MDDCQAVWSEVVAVVLFELLADPDVELHWLIRTPT
jgi:hypothetical protein